MTNNEEFATLTQGMTPAQIIKIFNFPRDLGVDRSNISAWRCIDPSKTYYRAMSSITLELFRIKVGLVPPLSA